MREPPPLPRRSTKSPSNGHVACQISSRQVPRAEVDFDRPAVSRPWPAYERKCPEGFFRTAPQHPVADMAPAIERLAAAPPRQAPRESTVPDRFGYWESLVRPRRVNLIAKR